MTEQSRDFFFEGILELLTVEFKLNLGFVEIKLPFNDFVKKWWKYRRIRKQLKNALLLAEQKYLKTNPEKKVAQILLQDLPLSANEDFCQVVMGLLTHLDEEKLTWFAAIELDHEWGDRISQEELRKGIEEYLPFLRHELSSIPEFREIMIASGVERMEKSLGRIDNRTERMEQLINEGQNQRLDQLKKISDLTEHFPSGLIEGEIHRAIEILRKTRLYLEYDRVGSALVLADRLMRGDLAGGTTSSRSYGLAWCSRILALGEESTKAEEYVEEAESLGNNDEIRLAKALLLAKKGYKSDALNLLADIKSSESRTVSFMIVLNSDGSQEAIKWLSSAQIDIADLNSDGKNSLLLTWIQISDYGSAFDNIYKITETDLDSTPILYHTFALVQLLKAVPIELRDSVLIQPPFFSGFRLASDASALLARNESHKNFLVAHKKAQELNCPNAAKIAMDYVLWLELSDPVMVPAGQARLRDMLRDPQTRLRVVHHAFQANIPVDFQAVEREIEREIALHGTYTPDAAIARFALLVSKSQPKEKAEYIKYYFDDLSKYFEGKFLLFYEMEMYLQAEMPEKANECLEQLEEMGISPSERRDILERINGVGAESNIEVAKRKYDETESLVDLIYLVNELERMGDWEGAGYYGKHLFEKTHSLVDAEKLVTSYLKGKYYTEIIDFIQNKQEYLEQSKNLILYYSWALYENGEFLEVRSQLAKAQGNLDDPNYKTLSVNVAISLGDWPHLLNFIDEEWNQRRNRTADELISAAKLGAYLNSPHTKPLIYAAVEKGRKDVNTLITAYMMAFAGGWEDEDDVRNWINEAAGLSGDNGPVQQKSIKDLLDLKPRWDEHEREISELLCHGEIPIFLAAQSINRTLINLTLLPAYVNQSENDPRHRIVIPSNSGMRPPINIDLQRPIGLEITTLLTWSLLKILDKILDSFNTIYLPHSSLAWLFEEKQKIAFHQPSRIRVAHRFRDLLARGIIERLNPNAQPDVDLAYLVGDELAALIAEAETKRADGTPPRFVVRSAPVFTLVSLLQEEADLSSHQKILCSCQCVVDKLIEKGQITSEEHKVASAYLKFQEKPWPNSPQIDDKAILYLDSLSISHFTYLELLEKIHNAGFTVVVSPEKIDETDILIRYENSLEEVDKTIESIRSAIHSRILSGKIKFGRSINSPDPGNQPILEHPSVSVIGLAKYCDTIISDDRFLNQRVYIQDGTEKAYTATTLDLLNSLCKEGIITYEQRGDYRTKLRQSAYVFIPIEEEELLNFLNAASIADGKLQETAELKAIRENISLVRMSKWLQIPNDVPWLENYWRVFISVLQKLWSSATDLTIAQIKSEWLINQLEFRYWAHFLEMENGYRFIKDGRVAYILMLFAPLQDTSQETKERYWNWVEEKVLDPITKYDTELFSWIISWFKSEISKVVEIHLPNEAENGK